MPDLSNSKWVDGKLYCYDKNVMTFYVVGFTPVHTNLEAVEAAFSDEKKDE